MLLCVLAVIRCYYLLLLLLGVIGSYYMLLGVIMCY